MLACRWVGLALHLTRYHILRLFGLCLFVMEIVCVYVCVCVCVCVRACVRVCCSVCTEILLQIVKQKIAIFLRGGYVQVLWLSCVTLAFALFFFVVVRCLHFNEFAFCAACNMLFSTDF